MKYDLVIEGATIVDRTGAPPFRGNVAVQGDRIAAVGDIDGDGARTIDAEGKHVTPGFVDIHTHLDAQVGWDPVATSSCWHGVTSVVLGNCGVTFAPCKPEYVHDFPGGTGRFVQRGAGYDCTVVNGRVFMEGGEHTGEPAGTVLRSTA